MSRGRSMAGRGRASCSGTIRWRSIGRPGVEAACLELQRRHRIDVNLVLLCCGWASAARALDGEALARLCHAADRWQLEVVRPLRNLRRRLKARLADREPNSVAERLAGARRVDARAGDRAGDRRRAPRAGAPGPGRGGAGRRAPPRDRRWRAPICVTTGGSTGATTRRLRTLLEQAFAAGRRDAMLDDGLRWLDGAPGLIGVRRSTAGRRALLGARISLACDRAATV